MNKKRVLTIFLLSVFILGLKGCNYQQRSLEHKVYKNPSSIKDIKNPTKAMKKHAVEYRNGALIRFIDNPSEELQLLAIERAYVYMTRSSNYSLIKEAYNILTHIKNPTEKVKLIHKANILRGIKKSHRHLEHIENPSEELQLALVKEDNHFMSYIKNPTEKVQLTAFKQIPDTYHWKGKAIEKIQRIVDDELRKEKKENTLNQARKTWNNQHPYHPWSSSKSSCTEHSNATGKSCRYSSIVEGYIPSNLDFMGQKNVNVSVSVDRRY